MRNRGKRWAWCALFAAGSVFATQLLSNFRFFQLLNLKAQDVHFVLRGGVSKSEIAQSEIVLLTADQKALDTFQDLRILWHPYYAEAIRAAGEAGARVIGLDLAFGVPVDKWEPDYDRLLSAAVSDSPVPVVCGYVAALNTNQAKRPVPINMLAAALGLDGFSNITSDADDFVRSQELIEAPGDAADTMPAPSFALRVAEKYLGSEVTFQKGRLVLGGGVVPISASRSILINYAGPPDTFPRISLADIHAAVRAGRRDQLKQWMDGKIVLVGADFIGDDRFATPFYTLFSGPRWTTAGVEIHANTIRTLLTHEYLLPAPEWARTSGLLLAAAISAGIVTSASAAAALPWLLALGAGVLGATHLLFRAGLILSTSETLTAATICLIVSGVYRFATAEKRGDLFRKAVSLFVGKRLAASLDDAHGIALTGTRQTVTILFTDIRGFTAFTEKVCDEQGPEAVVQMLNEYLAAMVSIIIKYRGDVNKFIGDGILAVFSDQDEGATAGDHALRAVRCAFEIVTAPSRFKTGAGIHTGLAVVGNVGSADKMEYTVLGDTVNLASRLESLNKEHKTSLLMSEATHSMLRGEVDAVRLGTISVRGKAQPIDLYTVTHV